MSTQTVDLRGVLSRAADALHDAAWVMKGAPTEPPLPPPVTFVLPQTERVEAEVLALIAALDEEVARVVSSRRDVDSRSAASGAELIATERQRQIDAEGRTPEHDDEHEGEELALAAVCYAAPHNAYVGTLNNRRAEIEDAWPWNAEDFKGDRDVRAWGGSETRQRVFESGRLPEHRPGAPSLRDLRVRELVKAGALIAAEIDRLQRLA